MLALAVTSCFGPATPDGADFRSIAPTGWAYGDTLTFEPETADSVSEGRLAIAVRHTGAYLYSNLWLEISTPLPNDTARRIDTVNVVLADVYGRWRGRGSDVSRITTDTLPGKRLLIKGRPVRVRHIMRADTVRDIEQVGLMFVK